MAHGASGTLLVLGDSLSAGYGVPTGQGWVTLLQKRLDQTLSARWTVVNASISGETTDGGLRRLPGLLEQHHPDVVLIELGGNDGLRGFPPSVITDNLTRMIKLCRQAGARVLLAGIQMPPNYGPGYTRAFAAIYPTLAQSLSTSLVPFILDGIYDRPELMQGDAMHPNAEAQPRLLDNVWPVLKPMLTSTTAAS
ncbi:MAG: arylesterase [Marinobacter sp.]|nr:arylesterase [Marinobacter sp.]